MSRKNKDQTLLLLGAIVIAVLFIGLSSQSIMVNFGSGGAGRVARGETVHWTLAVDSMTGPNLAKQISSCVGTSLVVTPETWMQCQTPTGLKIIPASGITSTTIPCGGLTSSGRYTLNGEFTAMVPNDANLGNNCVVMARYIAKTAPYTSTAPSFSTPDAYGPPQLTVTNIGCAPGLYTCSDGYTVRKCRTDGAWDTIQVCTTGCKSPDSSGVIGCNFICSPGIVKCVDRVTKKVCTSNGVWSGDLPASDGTGETNVICVSDILKKGCPNGEYVSLSGQCYTPPTTRTCPDGSIVAVDATCPEGTHLCANGDRLPNSQACPAYCGDGTCNNGETTSTCARDCIGDGGTVTCADNSVHVLPYTCPPETKICPDNSVVLKDMTCPTVISQTQNTTSGGQPSTGGQDSSPSEQYTLCPDGRLVNPGESCDVSSPFGTIDVGQGNDMMKLLTYIGGAILVLAIVYYMATNKKK